MIGSENHHQPASQTTIGQFNAMNDPINQLFDTNNNNSNIATATETATTAAAAAASPLPPSSQTTANMLTTCLTQKMRRLPHTMGASIFIIQCVHVYIT